ncbi:helix-turn-helix domain-containing protein [Azoarcus indigens]|uniref:Excisionase family DNA binding protein n=1 Tax=Azoarcus indigens TaxID=29545 RepID=A0A4R6DYM7_9RHOO|nr:helix-turn-helix domain-containing protein [Azoarcus indigens]TDN50456.1 excisionase family DNA binding protein [Azoarcus indigens]
MMASTEVRAVVLEAIRAYAESHPRPPQVTQSQAAEMLGISRATVSRMVRAGTLRLNGCGLIPISEIDRVLAADRS